MRRTRASIFALQLSIVPCLLGQMAGMAKPDSAALPVTKASNLTFTRDVAPILQQNCQSCHRPGEGTPFSMLTYEDARPWAAMMKKMVVTRAMPPWFEDGHTEKFANNRSLTQAQIDTIAAEEAVRLGCPESTTHDYLTRIMDYGLDEPLLEALEEFGRRARHNGILDEDPQPLVVTSGLRLRV